MNKIIYVGTPTDEFRRQWTAQGQMQVIQEAIQAKQPIPTLPDLSNVEVREVDLVALQAVIPGIDGPGVMFQFDELTNDFDFTNLEKLVKHLGKAKLPKGTRTK